MKYLITSILLCLPFAASGQQYLDDIQTLRADVNFAWTSPATLALRDQILAADRVAWTEVQFVMAVTNKNLVVPEGADPVATRNAALIAATATLAAKAPSSGQLLAAALNKYYANDYSGWTPEIIRARPDLVSKMALQPEASPDFQYNVFEVLRASASPDPTWQKFFKKYRLNLPHAQQIAVTAELKNRLVNAPARSAAQDKFLASLTADLVALQLQ